MRGGEPRWRVARGGPQNASSGELPGVYVQEVRPPGFGRSLGVGLAMGESNVSGAISGDVGIGFRAADFLDVQLVHETLFGGKAAAFFG